MMRLSSRLTHVLVLTDLNRSQVPVTEMPCIPESLFGHHLLGSFNGPGFGRPEVMIRKWKRERGWYSLVYAENQKVLDTGLASLTKAPGALSRGKWRHRVPSRESLRSPGRRVSKTCLCAPRNQQKRKRETERERKEGRKEEKHGDPSSDGAKVLY